MRIAKFAIASLSMRDTILLLLEAGPIEGIMQIEKLVFLSQGVAARRANFMPSRFGPFSRQLYEDMAILELLELITSEPCNGLSKPELAEEEFCLDYLLGDDERNEHMAGLERHRYSLTDKGALWVSQIDAYVAFLALRQKHENS